MHAVHPHRHRRKPLVRFIRVQRDDLRGLVELGVGSADVLAIVLPASLVEFPVQIEPEVAKQTRS